MSQPDSMERFEIRRQLGSGSFGAVFEAYDRERQTLVALKRPHEANAQSLLLFKQEFRALADIGHPNLACLYELHTDCAPWFFTMERVEGRDFLAYLRGDSETEQPGSQMTAVSLASQRSWGNPSTDPTLGPSQSLASDFNSLMSSDPSSTSGHRSPRMVDSEEPGPPPSFDRIKQALKQLAEGLRALHGAGKLHRDLKPSNVLVTAEDRLVILDFGLTTDTEVRLRLDPREGHAAGTPAYMAPELFGDNPGSEASDWYSVGVMLYQALTGCLPFPRNYHRQVACKLQQDAPPPRLLVPSVPMDLDVLCASLLQRSPELRPRGEQVVAFLETSNQNLELGWIQEARHISAFERESEQQRLFEALVRTRGQAALIHGPSGMGKSHLLRIFLRNLQQKDAQALILQGRCFEQESVPFKALDGVVDALAMHLRRLPNPELSALVPCHLDGLLRLFPVMGQVRAFQHALQGPSEVPDPIELRHRAFLALRDLLKRISEQQAVVLAIDDLQWGDLDSAAFLVDLLRPPAEPALLLAMTFRSDEAEASPVIQALLKSLAETEVPTVDIPLRELPPAEAQRLARSSFGDRPDADALAEWIALESGGNPFFIGELARHFQSEGRERAETGALNLDDYIRMRAASLQEQPRQLLETLAVAGYPMDWRLLKRACCASDWGETALAYLRSGRFIRSRSAARRKTIEPYHDRIREAIARTIAPEQVRAIHLRLASILVEATLPDVRALALHFEAGGEPRRAAEFAALAGDQAFAALAFEQASTFYRRALDLREATHHDAPQLWKKLGDALSGAGRSTDAAAAYLRACEGMPPDHHTRLRRRAAEEFLRGGMVDAGVSTLRQVLATIGTEIPRTPGQAILSILWHRLRLWLRGLDYQERLQDELPQAQMERIDILWAAAMGLGPVDPLRGADFQTRQLLLALDGGDSFRIVRALAHETIFVARNGSRSLKKTRALQSNTLALAERIGHPNPLSRAYLAAGIAATMQGRWFAAIDHLEIAERTLRQHCAGMDYELRIAQHQKLLCLSVLGELRELRVQLPGLLQEVREKGDLMSSTTLRTSLAYLPALAADDPARARRETGRAIEVWSKKSFLLQHFYDLVSRVNIELYAGNPATAHEALMQDWDALQKSRLLEVQPLRITAIELRGRTAAGLLTRTADGGHRQAIREVQTCVRQLRKEKAPYADALAFKLEAMLKLDQANPIECEDSLIQSEVVFETCRMKLHAMVVRHARGCLLGEAGKDIQASAEAWMRDQDILAPQRFVTMHLPGLLDSSPSEVRL